MIIENPLMRMKLERYRARFEELERMKRESAFLDDAMLLCSALDHAAAYVDLLMNEVDKNESD